MLGNSVKLISVEDYLQEMEEMIFCLNVSREKVFEVTPNMQVSWSAADHVRYYLSHNKALLVLGLIAYFGANFYLSYFNNALQGDDAAENQEPAFDEVFGILVRVLAGGAFAILALCLIASSLHLRSEYQQKMELLLKHDFEMLLNAISVIQPILRANDQSSRSEESTLTLNNTLKGHSTKKMVTHLPPFNYLFSAEILQANFVKVTDNLLRICDTYTDMLTQHCKDIKKKSPCEYYSIAPALHLFRPQGGSIKRADCEKVGVSSLKNKLA